MANGDDYNPLDPNPPGTVNPIGLQPNDPLIDWGSNLKPSDLQRFAHDPDGAVQNLIDQGKGPPDHHYISDPEGNLTATTPDHAALMDAAKQKLAEALNQQRGQQPETPLLAPPVQQNQGPIRTTARGISGNVNDYVTPMAAAAVPSPFPGGTQPGTSQPPEQPSGKVFIPGKGWVDRPAPPPAPTPQPTTPPVPAVEPTPTPIKNPPLPTARPGYIPPAGYDLEETPQRPAVPPGTKMQEDKGKKKKAESDDEEDKPFGPKALEGFSKSLAGVKVPTRPPLPAPGTPGVRSPVGINPSLAALLTSAGAHGPPTAAPSPLIRLIRGGY